MLDWLPIFEETWKDFYPLLTSTEPIDKKAVVAAAKALDIHDIRFYDSPIMSKFNGFRQTGGHVLATTVLLDVATATGQMIQPGYFYQAHMPGFQHAESWRKFNTTIPFSNPSDLHIPAYLAAAGKMGYKPYDGEQGRTYGRHGGWFEPSLVLATLLPMVGMFRLNNSNRTLSVINRPKTIFGHLDQLASPGAIKGNKPLMQFRDSKYAYLIAGQVIVSGRENVLDAALMDAPDPIKYKIIKNLSKDYLLENTSESGQEYILVETLKGKDPLLLDYKPGYGGILRAQVMPAVAKP